MRSETESSSHGTPILTLECHVQKGARLFARIEEFEKRGFKVDVTDTRFCISRDFVTVDATLYRTRGDLAWDLYLKKAPKFKRIMGYFSMIAERIVILF